MHPSSQANYNYSTFIVICLIYSIQPVLVEIIRFYNYYIITFLLSAKQQSINIMSRLLNKTLELELL